MAKSQLGDDVVQLSSMHTFEHRRQEIRNGAKTVMVCYLQQLNSDVYDSSSESDKAPESSSVSLLAAGP